MSEQRLQSKAIWRSIFGPTLMVQDGVISVRHPFGSTTRISISEITSVDKVDVGFPEERLFIRDGRNTELAISRKFDQHRIAEMLQAIRELRPDLSILTNGIWNIRPSNGG